MLLFGLFSLLAADALLAIIPYSPIIHDDVCVFEVNHVCDQATGKPSLDQIICWGEDGRVVGWRVLHRRPISLGHGRLLHISCGSEGPTVRIFAVATLFESWSYFDPEIADREQRPVTQRKELSERP